MADEDKPQITLDLATPLDMSDELTRRGLSHLIIVETVTNDSDPRGFRANICTRGCVHKIQTLFLALRKYVHDHWNTHD